MLLIKDKFNTDYNNCWLPVSPDGEGGSYRDETITQAMQLLNDAKLYGGEFYRHQRENIGRALIITSTQAASLIMQAMKPTAYESKEKPAGAAAILPTNQKEIKK